MIKIFTAMVLLLTCEAVNAGSEYVLPKGYDFGLHLKNNIKEYIEQKNDNKENSITYATMSVDSEENMWLTSCSRRMIKGIPETLCNTIKDDFVITISNKKPYPYRIYFDEKTMRSIANSKTPNLKLIERETNYKIDDQATVTLPMIAVSGNYNSNALVRDAKDGRMLYYSIEDKGKYKSYKLNLIGFKESIAFAEAFISTNK